MRLPLWWLLVPALVCSGLPRPAPAEEDDEQELLELMELLEEMELLESFDPELGLPIPIDPEPIEATETAPVPVPSETKALPGKDGSP